MTSQSGGNRFILLVLGLAVLAWGALGWLDLDQQTQAGFDTDGNNTIIRVYAGSEAERAGLQAGDRITHVHNIAVEDASSISRLPRVAAGERRSFTVQRGENTNEYFISYAPLSELRINLGRVSTIIGFYFVLFPILAYFRNPSKATQVLAMMGIGLGLAFMGGPYIAAYSIRSLVDVVISLFVFFGLAAMLYFLLVFPLIRAAADKAWVRRLVYLPAFLLWGLISWRLLLTPPATHTLNLATNIAAGVIVGSYFLISLFVLLRSYFAVNQMRRKTLSLKLMLWGTFFGLMPVTVAQFTSAASPQTLLPHQEYYFVALALIPMTWALSASKA